jgi:cytochrome c
MKTLIAAVLALAAAAPVLAADAGLELATKKNCLACHSVDKKVVGPAYHDVSVKYKGDKTALAKLTEKIQKGGAGVWGPVPMPPNQVTPDEAKTLATWVLSLK